MAVCLFGTKLPRLSHRPYEQIHETVKGEVEAEFYSLFYCHSPLFRGFLPLSVIRPIMLFFKAQHFTDFAIGEQGFMLLPTPWAVSVQPFA